MKVFVLDNQPVALGIDAGYKTIGYSAVSDKGELIGGAVELFKGQSERLKERAMYRRNRRSRQRYRPPRFNNRVKSKKPGWLAPSIKHKLDTHIKLVKKMKAILPITKVVIGVANFDIQAIKNPDISGVEYQQGEQLGFWNVRKYVLHRDHHQCQNPACQNRAKEKVLEVHHLGYWKQDRSNRPSNLITLCTRCHVAENHQPGGLLYGWQPKLKSFKPETFMSIVRWRLVNTLQCNHTYGFITQNNRIKLGLEKSHHNDAFVIAGGTSQARIPPTNWEILRHHNRGREKFYDAVYIDTRTGEKAKGAELNCGRRKRNRNLNGENLRKYRGQKVRKGRRSIRRQDYALQSGDVVLFEGVKRLVKGVFNYGKWVRLGNPGGKAISASIKKVTPLKKRKGLVIVI
ncbi:MAG: paclitaxel/taxanoid biosynthesis susceptibility protein TS1 [Anaerolineaceae bacterium 4572_78]|nr:MAG: paclitaxel/taxanoid biosynthesis susceptibility protein TS1 [Anaerolineaceae bacterium 4572_78]